MKYEDIDNKLKDINNQLLHKLDCDIFDEEINNLKTAINALSTTTGNEGDKKAVT